MSQCLHYDEHNVGLTATLIVGLHGLTGGSHVLMSSDRSSAVVVHECEEGTLILGDYTNALCVSPDSNRTHVSVYITHRAIYM